MCEWKNECHNKTCKGQDWEQNQQNFLTLCETALNESFFFCSDIRSHWHQAKVAAWSWKIRPQPTKFSSRALPLQCPLHRNYNIINPVHFKPVLHLVRTTLKTPQSRPKGLPSPSTLSHQYSIKVMLSSYWDMTNLLILRWQHHLENEVQSLTKHNIDLLGKSVFLVAFEELTVWHNWF